MKINIKKTPSGKYQLTFSPREKVKIIFWCKPDESINNIYAEFETKLLNLKKVK